MNIASPSKRKRKAAGPRITPLTSMPVVPSLTDTEWQPFLERLPARPQYQLLRKSLTLSDVLIIAAIQRPGI